MNQGDKARAQLYELQKQGENKLCMDCGSRDPRWASVSLGIFICIKCAGAHRNLGTHISTPKSLDQDNWTLEQVEIMRKHGNAAAKKYFEATLKPSDSWENSTKKVVSETLALENFVRRKYEYLEFVPKKEQFNSGVKQRSATVSSPGSISSGSSITSSGSNAISSSGSILPSYESVRKSKDDISLVSSFNKSTDLLGEEIKPREVTKSDIMLMYNTSPQLQPAPVATKSLPPPTPAPKPTYPGPNYNLSVNPFPGYNANPYGNPPSYHPSSPSPYGSPFAPPSPHSPYATPPSPHSPYSTPPSPLSPYATPPSPLSPSFPSPPYGGPQVVTIGPTTPVPRPNSLPSGSLIGDPIPSSPSSFGYPSYGNPNFANNGGINNNMGHMMYNNNINNAPRPNYGTPMPQQAPVFFNNNTPLDINYASTQFNFRM